MANFIDEIAKSLNSGSGDWSIDFSTQSNKSISNHRLGVEIKSLGNVTLLFGYCSSSSIARVFIDGNYAGTSRSDLRKIEMAYIKWLSVISLESIRSC